MSVKASCHPRKSNHSTCYEKEDLQLLRAKWNQKYPTRKIVTKNPTMIRKALKEGMKMCKDELCWMKLVKHKQTRKKIIKKDFAVFHPKNWKKNEREWLSNYDISKVLSQYKEFHPEFDFVSPSPIDFDHKLGSHCVSDKLCHFRVESYQKRKVTKIAIPLNLDEHDEDGSHWVSIFVDLERKFIFYFDSANEPMPKEVRTLIDRIREQTPLREYTQNTQHQKGESECGMYVLFFLISMLNGKTPKYFKTHVITDEEVAKFRKIYFNKHI
jgi:hypothetical protein